MGDGLDALVAQEPLDRPRAGADLEQTQPAAETGDEKVKKPTAPKEPERFIYDYSLCSLCGLCAEVCPVQSIRFSSYAYLVSQRREEMMMDLLAKLREKSGAVKGSGEKKV